jgi:lysophospholipase L1-like esterase
MPDPARSRRPEVSPRGLVVALVVVLTAALAVGLGLAIGRARSAPSGPSVLFVGDSFSAGGYTGVTPQQAFPCRTAGNLDRTCYLDAVGATGYQANGRQFWPGGRTYGERLADTRARYPEPSVIVVSGGRNDDPALIGTASAAYLSALRAAYPGVRVFVLEPFWMGAVPPSVSQARLAVKASADAAGATWVPTSDWLAPTDLSWDLVHPNQSGQDAITDRLTTVLRAAL